MPCICAGPARGGEVSVRSVDRGHSAALLLLHRVVESGDELEELLANAAFAALPWQRAKQRHPPPGVPGG